MKNATNSTADICLCCTFRRPDAEALLRSFAIEYVKANTPITKNGPVVASISLV